MDSMSNQPYKPTVYYFLGGFDVYDREETLGEELNKYNPNNKEGRYYLIKKYIVDRERNLTYRHKFMLLDVLEKALSDVHYDFSEILEENDDEYSSMPDGWNIDNPRGFFEDILKIAKESWKDELYKASLEDPNTW